MCHTEYTAPAGRCLGSGRYSLVPSHPETRVPSLCTETRSRALPLNPQS